MPTLTRQELYELVWSTPMTKLAEQFGLSDVGLTKICDRHRVPTPPRGYWAKKEAGKPIKQAIFVQVDDPFLDRVEIASSRDRLPEPVRAIVERHRAERKQASQLQRSPIMKPPPTVPIAEPHPAIRETAATLRKAKPSEIGAVTAIGPGLCGISVSAGRIERVISVLDGLARACDSRGLSLAPADTRMSVAVGKDSLTFEIKERTKQVQHVLTKAEIATEEKRRRRAERGYYGRLSWNDIETFAPLPPKFDSVRTGELGLEIHGWGDGLRRSWRDGKTQVLEAMIDQIVDGFEAHIAVEKLHREDRERAEAERAELARRHDLVNARRERESNRKALLSKLIRSEQEAAKLRNWISVYEPHANASPDLRRMIDWARSKLQALEQILDPLKLADELQARKLFPEVDELRDPLGDPPPLRWW